MSMLTCITCQLAFSEADVQRVHYKSDWHKYNLKRKVVELPPVSAEDFRKKLQTQNDKIAKENEDDSVIGITCKICTRRFHSFNSYKSHLQSKKHKEAEKKELAEVSKRVASERLQIEKDEELDDEEIFEMEEKAVNKAVAEAKSNMNQPIVLKGDKKAAKEKKREKLEFRRKIWCQQQMKLILDDEEDEKKIDEVMEEDGGWEDLSEGGSDWEDMSDDDDDWTEEVVDAETKEKNRDDDTKSQDESSVVSETSDVSGIMSRIKYDSDADVASIGSHESKSEQREIGLRECLFCPRMFASADDKILHMTRHHSFFIPELQYVVALDGLLIYLGYKIGVGNHCIWCNKSNFPSLTAVRSHMADKGHCRMFVEKDAALEYADFYDFSSSYPDGEGPDDEDDDSLQMMSVDDESYVPPSEDTSQEEYELVLPTGARIGNRKLWRYYRQSFPTVDRGIASRKSRVQKLLSQYSSIGWHCAGADSAAVKKFRRDITYVQHLKKKHAQQLGTKNNKTMMKHFRASVMF